jgi:hypothetical protein
VTAFYLATVDVKLSQVFIKGGLHRWREDCKLPTTRLENRNIWNEKRAEEAGWKIKKAGEAARRQSLFSFYKTNNC